jgi:prepilin-type processing-associated H-X9-DG protein
MGSTELVRSVSYAKNIRTNYANTPQGTEPYMHTRVVNPSRKVMLVDGVAEEMNGNPFSVWFDCTYYHDLVNQNPLNNYYAATVLRHDLRCNVAFVDGHVVPVQPDFFTPAEGFMGVYRIMNYSAD